MGFFFFLLVELLHRFWMRENIWVGFSSPPHLSLDNRYSLCFYHCMNKIKCGFSAQAVAVEVFFFFFVLPNTYIKKMHMRTRLQTQSITPTILVRPWGQAAPGVCWWQWPWPVTVTQALGKWFLVSSGVKLAAHLSRSTNPLILQILGFGARGCCGRFFLLSLGFPWILRTDHFLITVTTDARTARKAQKTVFLMLYCTAPQAVVIAVCREKNLEITGLGVWCFTL